MMQTKIITIITLAFVCVSAQAYVAKDFSSQRKLFLQVESELKKGKLNAYRKHKQALQTYPLFPYLKYQLLHLNINTLKHSELSAFLSTYHDSPVSEKLRKEWLSAKAKKKQWEEFLLAYEADQTNDIVMQCHYINARLTAKHDKTAFQAVPQIWINSKSLPKECDEVFDKWKQAGGLQRNIIWQRIKLTVEQGNHELAKFLAKELPDHEQKIVELWIRTHNDPYLITKPHNFTAKHSAINEILTHGMRKIARKNPDEAVKLWHALEKQHKFNEHHWGAVVKEIGLALSRRLNTNAEKWLTSVPSSLQGMDVYDARLKVAVHHNAWETIAQIYNAMPEADRRNDKWQYWYARALEMLGAREQSQALLQDLAQLRTYYGFLASSRILKPYAFNHEQSSVPDALLAKVLKSPAIARAHELKQLGRVHVGKSEWRKGIKNLDDNERLAAAHLASKWQMPNWAIIALADASKKNDLELRFPKTYADHIHKAAERNHIDPELLFAITRQESAFIPTAKSPAGALGLMQIMPKTGKVIAKANRESFKHHSELLQPAKNIRFGSKYVRMMLDRHQQNPALAAASYNAGPHRVAAWLPDYDMPADCWIETIPFRETREYVQNVLTYTVIYQQLLGKTPRMNKYMPIINGKRRGGKD